MSRTFGINRTRDHVRALRRDIERLRADPLDPVLARHCADIAWSICEWAFSEMGLSAGYARLADLQEDVRRTCPAISYMQDICTESKHTKITMYVASIRKAELHTGDYSDEFSRDDFDVSRLQIVTGDGSTIWFIDAAEQALQFWERLCEQHGI